MKIHNRIGACPCNNVLNTECVDEECICKDGFIMTDDKMRCLTKIVPLGKSCENDDQCVRFALNSKCLDRICQCVENFLQIDKNNCRSLVYKEEDEISCDNGNRCGINQDCVKGKCVCTKFFVASTVNQTICLPYANFDDKCEESPQCEHGSLGYGAVCENNLCKCDKNHTKSAIAENKFICERNVFQNENCKTNSDCASYLDDPKMFCKKGRCTCRKGYALSDGFHRKCILIEDGSSSSPQSFNWLIFFIIVGIVIFVCALCVLVIYCCNQ